MDTKPVGFRFITRANVDAVATELLPPYCQCYDVKLPEKPASGYDLGRAVYDAMGITENYSPVGDGLSDIMRNVDSEPGHLQPAWV